MNKGDKLELLPLQREDRSGEQDYNPDDPQFNGLLFPKLSWVVFYETWDNQLSAVFFTSKVNAEGWCQEKMMDQMRGIKI